MTLRRSSVARRCLVMAALLSTAACAPALVEAGPGRLSDTVSLGRAIQDAGPRTTHILFVHGMRADGPHTSDAFVAGMAERLHPLGFRRDTPVPDIPVDVGEWPEDARYAGARIWLSRQQWDASRPFVQRHVLRRADGAVVVLDEINWWPLLFPLKCRFLLLPEAELTGADIAHLRLCSKPWGGGPGWLSQAEVDEASAKHPAGGRGAVLNRALKQQIFDWGLSDAVIALGPGRLYIRRAMQRAFAAALPFEGRTAEQQDFTIISESLGSFAVLDALRPDEGEEGPVDLALDRSASLYFFANQIALLELARLTGIEGEVAAADIIRSAPPVGAAGTGTFVRKQHLSPLAGLARWQEEMSLRSGHTKTRQIIAFSDPSDLLTWRVPSIKGVTVVNVHAHNGATLFGLLADPVAAHTGHSRNRRVLDVIFGEPGRK